MSRALTSGVYTGWLRHRRTAPVAHAFTYPLFMVLLDIDRLTELMAVSPFTSHNRWNWASFHDADHTGDRSLPLRQRLALDAARHGHRLPDGPILLLTHLRYLGYVFNPVSFFYCHDRDGRLRLVLAEVRNTFGGRHNYWLEPESHHASTDEAGSASAVRPFRAAAAKSFYVSPFMPPDLDYRFAFTQPGTRLVAHIAAQSSAAAESDHRFDATLSLTYQPWTSAVIVRTLLRHPAMTLRVMAGIHWEAARLWWKGLPIVPRPTPDGVQPDHAAPDAERFMSTR